jgi:hypothetical protein
MNGVSDSMHGEAGMWGDSAIQRVYMRELPGGGFVAIDVQVVRVLFRPRGYCGTVIVERRAPERREGHVPPVIASTTGNSAEAILCKLLPTAQCIPAIGAALVRQLRQRESRERASVLVLG